MSIEVATPLLVALKGYPGSGKSTIGAALSRELHWPLVDKDAIQAILDRHRVADEGAGYEMAFQVARSLLARGISVIVDSPFWQRTYDNARGLADELGARLLVVECRCDDDVQWRRRIEARQATGPVAKRTTTWEALQAFRRRYDADAYDITAPHLIVDTTAEPASTVAHIRAWLEQQAGQYPRPPDVGRMRVRRR
jgi:predicted kinase